MKDLYQDVIDITKLAESSEDGLSVEKCVSKLTEEVGELAQVLNKTIGLKGKRKSFDEVRSDVIEESADVIQNVLCITSKFGISLEEIIEEMYNKNIKWKERYVGE
jgi:NTP pyrophosphatase (non-canonical NTP hydrolase)